jgi:drug/metabolite transporter (DMT)-like permease
MNGYLYALCASISNSTIGIVSYESFALLSFYQIAIFKNLIAFIALSIICALNRNCRNQVYELYSKKHQMAFLSFWGIFILCFFQIKAFSMTSLSLVSFMFYAAGILTIGLGYFILNEAVSIKKITGISLAMIGGSLIFENLADINNFTGIIYAIFGGFGYSIFLVFGRKFSITPNIGFLWWLTGLGTIFLLIPTILTNIEFSIPKTGFTYLIFLAIVPTICGFYLTSKALRHTEASKVQIIEMSEPIFTTIGAFYFFGQSIEIYHLFGGALILFGLLQAK